MYKSGIELPKVSFSTITYAKIPLGGYFIGFDLDNSGKLSKVDNAGVITVIEGGGSGGLGVASVTGLDTDNTNPQNPIVKISVDGTTITGLGTPASPLIANGISYTLPISSSTILGGIKIGNGLSIDGSGVVSTTGGSGIIGSGTVDYATRWTPDGTTLGIGVIRDNGATVGIGSIPFGSYKLTVRASGISQDAIYADSVSNDGIGIRVAQSGAGTYSFGIYASTGSGAITNTGVRGDAFSAVGTTGIGGSFLVSGPGTNYGIQIQDGSQAVGKVLTCMTIGGAANWSDLQYINLQKVITTSNYVLTDADNDYTIFVNNGATAISISLGVITIPNFSVGFIQEGTADVTFVGVTNPIGLKLKGQGYQAFIERKLSTSTYYLLGNTKA